MSVPQNLLYLADAMESVMVSELVQLWRPLSSSKCHPLVTLKHTGGKHGVPALCLHRSFILFTVQ